MGRSARLFLIGNVTGLSRVACLNAFVCITLHLLVRPATLEPFVYITLHLRFRLLTRCSLSLLRRCREGNRASGNNNHRENRGSHSLLQCVAYSGPVTRELPNIS